LTHFAAISKAKLHATYIAESLDDGQSSEYVSGTNFEANRERSAWVRQILKDRRLHPLHGMMIECIHGTLQIIVSNLEELSQNDNHARLQWHLCPVGAQRRLPQRSNCFWTEVLPTIRQHTDSCALPGAELRHEDLEEFIKVGDIFNEKKILWLEHVQ
jgi:hypothetical protein